MLLRLKSTGNLDMTTLRSAFLVAIAWAVLELPQATPQEPSKTNGVTAIDVTLTPDEVMIDHAKAANARLRADYPKGFELDATHAPHVTVIQRFVRTADLDKVNAAIAKVLKDENPISWELKTTGYYDIPIGNLGVAGIVIEPTKDLLRLQQKLIDAVAPFTVEKGTDAAFVPQAGRGSDGCGTHRLCHGLRSEIQRQELQPARHYRHRHPEYTSTRSRQSHSSIHIQGSCGRRLPTRRLRNGPEVVVDLSPCRSAAVVERRQGQAVHPRLRREGDEGRRQGLRSGRGAYRHVR